jgi:hypothetical protein
MSTAHHSFDAGDELAKPVGSDQVVVQAGLQTKDRSSSASRDRDNRGIAGGSDTTADFKTIEIW